MTVIINEFEVLDSQPGARRGQDTETPASAAPALPDPEDLRRLLAEGAEQQLRRFAD
jgi:hypothetical protein